MHLPTMGPCKDCGYCKVLSKKEKEMFDEEMQYFGLCRRFPEDVYVTEEDYCGEFADDVKFIGKDEKPNVPEPAEPANCGGPRD